MNKEQQIIEWFNICEDYIETFVDEIFQCGDVNFINYNGLNLIQDFKSLCFFLETLKKEYFINNSSLDFFITRSLAYIIFLNKNDFSTCFKFLKDLLIKKNRDYGNSFDKSIKKFGWIYLAIELDKKKNRLHSLLKSKEKPNYESIEDTLLDIAGYCVLALIYIDNNKE